MTDVYTRKSRAGHFAFFQFGVPQISVPTYIVITSIVFKGAAELLWRRELWVQKHQLTGIFHR